MTTKIDPRPDGNWGADVLYGEAWRYCDHGSNGGMVQDGDRISVAIGRSNGLGTRRLWTALTLDGGTYRMRIVGRCVADFYVQPGIVMHTYPSNVLTDPDTLPKVQMIPGFMSAVLDFEVKPYGMARVQIVFDDDVPMGTDFVFEAITLRRKVG